MQGNLIVLNTIDFRGLLNYKLSEDGAGLKITEVEPILQSADPELPAGRRRGRSRRRALLRRLAEPDRRAHAAQPARPSRDKLHGRVYRVTAEGRPLLKPPVIAGAPIPQLLDLLKEPENRVRYRARIELGARDTKQVMAALQTWIAKLDPKDPAYEHHMMEALWAHQWQDQVNEALLDRMLQVERSAGHERRRRGCSATGATG